MTVQLNNDGTLAITAMSLVEFLPEIEQAIHNGYMLNLDKNEGVPQQYGPMLVLTMYPVGDVEVMEIDKADDFKRLGDSNSTQADEEGNEVHTVVQQSQGAVVQVVETPIKVDGRKKKS